MSQPSLRMCSGDTLRGLKLPTILTTWNYICEHVPKVLQTHQWFLSKGSHCLCAGLYPHSVCGWHGCVRIQTAPQDDSSTGGGAVRSVHGKEGKGLPGTGECSGKTFTADIPPRFGSCALAGERLWKAFAREISAGSWVVSRPRMFGLAVGLVISYWFACARARSFYEHVVVPSLQGVRIEASVLGTPVANCILMLITVLDPRPVTLDPPPRYSFSTSLEEAEFVSVF